MNWQRNILRIAMLPLIAALLNNGPSQAASSRNQARNWYEVARAVVKRGEDKTVGGSRYELHFFRGSLSRGAEITIKEWDGHFVDFQLGPHGTQFGTPVELTIDYAGSNCDPSANDYDGSAPVFYWLNEQTGIWEVVPGRNNPGSWKYTVKLTHFSRYRLSGKDPNSSKAGW